MIEQISAIQKRLDEVIGPKAKAIDIKEFQKVITDVGMMSKKLDKVADLPEATDKIVSDASASGVKISAMLMRLYQAGVARNTAGISDAREDAQKERKTKFDECERAVRARQAELRRLIQ